MWHRADLKTLSNADLHSGAPVMCMRLAEEGTAFMEYQVLVKDSFDYQVSHLVLITIYSWSDSKHVTSLIGFAAIVCILVFFCCFVSLSASK